MKYAPSVKTRRMQAIADAMDLGPGAASLEIGSDGMASVLVTIPLARPAAFVDGDTLSLDSLPRNGRAVARGQPRSARIVNAAGTVVVDELTVGREGTDIIVDRDYISVGQMLVIEGPCTIQHAP
jgi:hypothetical protein